VIRFSIYLNSSILHLTSHLGFWGFGIRQLISDDVEDESKSTDSKHKPTPIIEESALRDFPIESEHIDKSINMNLP